jgi:DNA-binding NtrC family response regulator
VDLAHQLEPGDAGHLDVAQHEVEPARGDALERLAGIAGRGDLVAGAREDALECTPVQLFVVDDQDVGTAQRALQSGGGARAVYAGRARGSSLACRAAVKCLDSGTDEGAVETSIPSRGAGEAPATPTDGPGLVLLIDDEPLLLRALQRILRADGHETVLAETPAEAWRTLHEPELDVVLLDLFLGGHDGLEVLDRIKRERPEVEVVMMTGHASVESAVGCMRHGAFDYLAKPFDDVHRVRTTVRKAIERRRLVRRNRELEAELRDRGAGPPLVGRSPAMRRLVRTLESLRASESNVLVTGESGTGKELVARAIHAGSPRAAGPFVPVDCGALPETIIESELFGHEKGAFTGAVGSPGLFRMAQAGTLFLDEVGEIPAHVQAKLLRALQHKEVRPVGASGAVPVDLRIVTATHRDLAAMVEVGHFRMDLFYRLNVLRIEIPPLRERREDIPLLAHHFAHKHRRPGCAPVEIEPDAIERLVRYDWPGNVRELENAIESALALAQGPRLTVRDFALPAPAASFWQAPREDSLPLSLEAYERCALERALEECDGDARAAAARLGVGRSTFYRKLQRHAIKLSRPGLSGARPIR